MDIVVNAPPMPANVEFVKAGKGRKASPSHKRLNGNININLFGNV